jgi:hypothetical protein
MKTSRAYSKEFRQVFDAMSMRHGWHGLFQDFVEIAALTIHQHPYQFGQLARDEEYERIEAAYMTAIKKFKPDEMDGLTKMFAITLSAVMEHQEDFLGQLYMELGVSNKHRGQFFTPSPISRFMAEIQMADLASIIERQGYFTLCEPACGSGVMVIEAANAVRGKGFEPSQVMLFQATDIGRACFNMAYLQCAALGLAGEVVHGDTIMFEQYEVRETPLWKRVRKQHGLPPLPKPEAPPPYVPPPPMTKAERQGQLIFSF